MDNVKRIILFIAGMLLIPPATAFVTAFVFNINPEEQAIFECLWVDYVLAYIAAPLLYRPPVKKRIPDRRVFFAMVFFVFWFWEVFRILVLA